MTDDEDEDVIMIDEAVQEDPSCTGNESILFRILKLMKT